MKKPEGKAEAGWYDAPEIEGYLQYWNGKYWTSHKQVIDGNENLELLPKYKLSRFLFRAPLMEDGVFVAYLVVSGLTLIYIVTDTFSYSNGIIAIALLVPSIVVTLLWIYILFLLILIPRRIKDKKSSKLPQTKNGFENESNLNLNKIKASPRKLYLAVIAIILVGLLFATQSNSSFEKEAEAFFNKQKEISSILNDWNKESALLLGIIQKVSNSEMDFPSAVYAINESNSRITPILDSLRAECADVPIQSLDKTGEEQAAALAWNMLKVTCDLVPLQHIEYIAIFDAQWSDSATQSTIDYHVGRLESLGEQRRTAATQALREFEKYASGSQLEQIRQLINVLG